ncbi:MAG TPA: hypothetical protein VNT42_11435 [Sphingomonas sp.]|nr:hypothetical protein [Sphingomonas sp.]
MINQAVSADLPLARLKALHAELNILLEQLHASTARDVPDRDRLAGIRLSLTKASRKRTNLLHIEVYGLALAIADPAERARIEELQEQDSRRLLYSSDHINSWTLARIESDWTGYRQASFAMRARMRRRIAAEERALYRVLERVESGQRGSRSSAIAH